MDSSNAVNNGINHKAEDHEVYHTARRSFNYYLKNWFSLLFRILLGLRFYFYFLIPKSKTQIKGKLVVVTGGGNGLGRCLCTELVKEGCSVAILDIDYKAAAETAESLKSYGTSVRAYKVDVSNFDEVKKATAEIQEDLGPIDIWINNAGLLQQKKIDEMTPEEIHRTVGVNLLSHIWSVQCVLPKMIQRKKGHIVAISSMAGIIPVAVGTSYVTTKHGVNGFMNSLRLEMKRRKCNFIKTTIVMPYFMETNPELMKFLDENELLKLIPTIDPAVVATSVVEGIMKGEEKVYAQSWMKIIAYVYRSLMPLQLQDLFLNASIE